VEVLGETHKEQLKQGPKLGLGKKRGKMGLASESEAWGESACNQMTATQHHHRLKI